VNTAVSEGRPQSSALAARRIAGSHSHFYSVEAADTTWQREWTACITLSRARYLLVRLAGMGRIARSTAAHQYPKLLEAIPI
jgi:hypothetical protein